MKRPLGSGYTRGEAMKWIGNDFNYWARYTGAMDLIRRGSAGTRKLLRFPGLFLT